MNQRKSTNRLARARFALTTVLATLTAISYSVYLAHFGLPYPHMAKAEVAPQSNELSMLHQDEGLQQDEVYSLTEIPILFAQSGWGPVELNTSIGEDLPNDGNPMQINGISYEKGIGTHSTSVIAYGLQGQCATFTTDVGVDDEVGDQGSVVFQIYGNQQQLYDSGLMNGSDPAKSTGEIDLTSVHELLLVVTDGGDSFHQDHANWANPQLACSSLPTGDGAAFRHLRGYWEPVMDWPVKAIHASLLPSGHILSHASAEPGAIGSNDPNAPHDTTKVDLADIQEWNHEWVDHTSEEMYCSAHTLLEDGRIFEFGGHGGANSDFLYYGQDQASIFDISTKTWTTQSQMSQPRWYPSAVTLGNGHVMAIGGSHAGGNNFFPEVWMGGSWRTLDNVSYESRLNNNDFIFDHTYPFVHLLSDGRVFWAGWDEYMAYLNPIGAGLWSQNYLREDIQRAWGTPVMYRQDKILLAGGVDHEDEFGLATHSAVTINLTEEIPVVSPTGSMLFPRADVDGTILADGAVMVNGGGYDHILGYSPTHIYIPEIWNPETGKWVIGTAAANPRGYHSSTLLLPDGRVWTGGGECGDSCDKGMTAQVYNPPYLFKNDGSGGFAVRPVINDAPEQISYGASFDIDVTSANGINKLTFIRLGSTTHHINFEQRYLELDFTATESALSVVAPSHGNLAPPGFYMLFVVDNEGVPSSAKIMQLLPTTPTPASCNLLKNGDFEAGLLHWTGHGGAALTPNAYDGVGAVSISSDWIGQTVDASPGMRYIFSGQYRTEATTFILSAGIDFLNSAGDEIGEEQISLLDSAEYNAFSLATTTPPGTAAIQLWLYSDTGSILLADNLDAHQDGCVENVPPSLEPVADQTNIINDLVMLILSATDPEESPLVYSASNLPPALTILPTTGVISGTVTTTGTYSVTATVTDTRGGLDSHTFSWTISEPPNSPPILEQIDSQTGLVGERIELIRLSAVDSDDANLDYEAEGLPPGTAIDSITGIIGGTPTTPGIFMVTVTVSDGRGGSDSISFSWEISEKVNSAPVGEVSDQTHIVGTTVSLQLSSVDVDDDPITYDATGLPPGLTLDPETGQISGMVAEAGKYPVVVKFRDDRGGVSEATFTWNVEKLNEPGGTGEIFIYLPRIS